jgi:hypothetical protein
MPRKTLKQRQTKRPTDTDVNRNRIRAVSNNLIGNEDPDDVMIELLEVLTEGPKSVQAGKMYIFVYNAKTNQLRYDQNPLVAVTDIFQWGFRGINLHWGESRQYTWAEVAGGMYEVYSSEVKDLQMLPFANFKLNT